MASAWSASLSSVGGEADERGLIPPTRPDFSTLLTLSYWKWRENPATMVPAMISAAVAVASQAVLLLFLMAILSQLASAGVLRGLAEALQAASPEQILRAFTRPEILSVAVPASAAALVVFVAVNIMGTGFATSAEYGTYLAVLHKGRVGVGDVLRELGRRWAGMAWTVLVVNAVAWGPVCIALLYLLVNLGFFVSGSSQFQPGVLIGLLASLFLILVLSVIGFAVYCLSIYSYAAVAVSGTRGLKAVRQSFRVSRSAAGTSAVYVLLRMGIIIFSGLLSVFATYGVSLSSLITVVLSLSLVPILHLLKTQVCFMQSGLPLPPLPFLASTSVGRDLARTFPRRLLNETSKGLRSLRVYLAAPANLPYHLVSFLFFLCGVVAGGTLSSSGLSEVILALGYEPGRINPQFLRSFPISLGVDISFHNWQVSVATALSGLALILPAAITEVFNGFLLGVVASLTPTFSMFLAAILPHGVIELPCFLVAGSAGLRLGVGAVKAWRRGTVWDDPWLRMALRETVYIVIGLAPFFLVAGFMEALVTPFVMRSFGWT